MVSSRGDLIADMLKSGYSYEQIHQKLNISKTTINHWFKKLPQKDQENIKEFRIENWQKAYKKTAEKIKKETKRKEKEIQKKAAGEIKKISKRELFLIGLALYWGEGNKRGKNHIQFTNSDPKMISLMMSFFRKIYQVKEDKFYMQMVLHQNTSAEKALNFWSNLTGVPKKQFKKPCFSLSKSSQRKRNPKRLPYGTLQIRILDKNLTHTLYGHIAGLASIGNAGKKK